MEIKRPETLLEKPDKIGMIIRATFLLGFFFCIFMAFHKNITDPIYRHYFETWNGGRKMGSYSFVNSQKFYEDYSNEGTYYKYIESHCEKNCK